MCAATSCTSARMTSRMWCSTVWHTYHEQTEPLKDYYGKQGKLKSIDGTQGIRQTEQIAVQALGL